MSVKISELLDGQVGSGETAQVLDQVAADAMLRDRYTVYALIGDVLRGNSTPDDGFSIRIFDRMKAADDIYDSFRLYQNKLLREYASMADEFHFRTVDARRSIDQIQDELRKQVAAFLEPVDKPAEASTR